MTMVSVDHLPELPPSGCGWGYDWMDELSPGWVPISSWGLNGYDLGEWPYVVVCACSRRLEDGTRIFGVATYCEGDIDVEAFDTREDIVHAIDVIATFYWRLRTDDERPPGLPPIGPVPEELTGPFSRKRLDGTQAK